MPATPVLWTDSFQVNTTDSGAGGAHQTVPMVTQLAFGYILVAWQSDTNVGAGMPAGTDIIGQIYDPGGRPVGAEFRLNYGFTADDEMNPAIAALADGRFAVVHEDNASSTDRSIRMQVFAGDGVSQGSLTIASDSVAGGTPNYLQPAIVSGSSTSAVVAYVRDGGGGNQDVIYRFWNPTTNSLGNETTAYNGIAAAGAGIDSIGIDVLSDGNYVLVYSDADSASASNVRFRIIDTVGNLIGAGGDVIVGTSRNDDVSVVALKNGGFAVTWTSNLLGDYNIRTRVFQNDGTGITNNLPVATTTAGVQSEPAIAALRDGGFLIAWADDNTGTVRGQRFDEVGGKVGDEFIAGSAAAVDSVSLKGLADGRISIVWTEISGADSDVRMAIFDPRDMASGFSQGPDVVVGTVANNAFSGGGGNDLMYGGEGNDVLFGGEGEDLLDGGNGFDNVSYNGAAEGVVISLDGSIEHYGEASGDSLVSIEGIYGSTHADLLVGDDGANRLDGQGGQDTLKGGAGDDTLVTLGNGVSLVYGGLGADRFEGAFSHVRYDDDDYGDLVISMIDPAAGTGAAEGDSFAPEVARVTAGSGNDHVMGNAASNMIEGAGGNDVLDGGIGNDRLIGGGGADTLTGGLGNDVYENPLGDTITELAGGGTDTVESSATFSLAALVQVENLTLTGAAGINAGGNALNNVLTGNTGNNILNGNAGADTMAGGIGNDIYYVDTAGDVTTELFNQGTDLVSSSVSRTLSANIENLNLSGAANIDGNGNTGGNVINGNAGNNILRGYEGGDTLNGGGGNDILLGGTSSDALNPGSDAVRDIIRFSAVGDSTGSQRDIVTGMDLNGEDVFDFTVVPTSIGVTVTSGALNLATINADLAAAVNANLNPNAAVLFDPSSGDLNLAGHVFLVVDANGDGSYTAGQDYVVQLINPAGALTLDDFV